MHIEPVELFGRTGRDFVSYSDDGIERFSARLWDGDSTLQILWSDHLPRTVHRLRNVQRLAGESEAFDMISGQASSEFRKMIIADEFDAEAAAHLLHRGLGGLWRVAVIPRANSMPPTFDIAATRVGEAT